MPGENVKLILEKLDELIQAAGGLGETVWPYLIHQQIIYGYTSLCVLLISIFISLLTRKKFKESCEDGTFSIGAGICIFTLVLGVISMIYFLTHGIGLILNPEYQSIKDLMDLITPGP